MRVEVRLKFFQVLKLLFKNRMKLTLLNWWRNPTPKPLKSRSPIDPKKHVKISSSLALLAMNRRPPDSISLSLQLQLHQIHSHSKKHDHTKVQIESTRETSHVSLDVIDLSACGWNKKTNKWTLESAQPDFHLQVSSASRARLVISRYLLSILINMNRIAEALW